MSIYIPDRSQQQQTSQGEERDPPSEPSPPLKPEEPRRLRVRFKIRPFTFPATPDARSDRDWSGLGYSAATALPASDLLPLIEGGGGSEEEARSHRRRSSPETATGRSSLDQARRPHGRTFVGSYQRV